MIFDSKLDLKKSSSIVTAMVATILYQVQLPVHHLHLHPSSHYHGGLLFKDGQVNDGVDDDA